MLSHTVWHIHKQGGTNTFTQSLWLKAMFAAPLWAGNFCVCVCVSVVDQMGLWPAVSMPCQHYGLLCSMAASLCSVHSSRDGVMLYQRSHWSLWTSSTLFYWLFMFYSLKSLNSTHILSLFILHLSHRLVTALNDNPWCELIQLSILGKRTASAVRRVTDLLCWV